MLHFDCSTLVNVPASLDEGTKKGASCWVGSFSVAAADVCTSQSFWLARLCACSTAFWPCVARLLVCRDVSYYVGP